MAVREPSIGEVRLIHNTLHPLSAVFFIYRLGLLYSNAGCSPPITERTCKLCYGVLSTQSFLIVRVLIISSLKKNSSLLWRPHQKQR